MNEALKFEISILHLILQRNRNQHRRAIYFRRLEMVMSAITRCSILTTASNSNGNEGCGGECHNGEDQNTNLSDCDQKSQSSHHGRLGISDMINQIRKERHKVGVSKVSSSSSSSSSYYAKNWQRGRTHEDDEKWTLDQAPTTAKNSQQPQQPQVNQLYQTLHNEIPQILSRINHASSALYIELSRGYFVPFLSVCLACISRIRMILIYFANDGCALYHQVVLSSPQCKSCNHIIDGHDHNGDNNDSSGNSKNKIGQLESKRREWYVEVDDGQYHKIMNERLTLELRRKYEYYAVLFKSPSSLQKTIKKNKKSKSMDKDKDKDMGISTNENDSKSNNEDENDHDHNNKDTKEQHRGGDIEATTIEIGECVDIGITSYINCNNSDDDNFSNSNSKEEDEDNQNNHNADRNFEMIQLLKERKKQTKQSNIHHEELVIKQKKGMKKRDRCSTEEMDGEDRSDQDGGSVSVNKNMKKEEKKKKKKKKKLNKKNKNKKTDVIDDIFNGF